MEKYSTGQAYMCEWSSGLLLTQKCALHSGLSSLEQSSHSVLTLRPLHKQTDIVNKYLMQAEGSVYVLKFGQHVDVQGQSFLLYGQRYP